AEMELRGRHQAIAEELNRYQNQYYQVLQQANMRVMQTMSQHITQASQEVAKEMKIPLVVSKEAAFYYDPNFDMTQIVIEKMNKDFDVQAKKEATK
ncbi:MAG: OmpH family outer membrane protein, partial [Chlamydiae bacterium]|nr:OmpH family outer membrane protein [Chlamydiota bacterium]